MLTWSDPSPGTAYIAAPLTVPKSDKTRLHLQILDLYNEIWSYRDIFA